MSRIKEVLEKANEKTHFDGRGFFKDTEHAPAILKPVTVKAHEFAPDIQIEYSETKVHDVDLKTLLKNKVFSHSYIDGITDHFKLLRLQILNQLDEIGGNSLLITSANPGEGKTFTTINLGMCLAQEFSRTVLLVDADLKNPTNRHYDFAADFFSLSVSKGLADYLLGQAEISEILLNPGIQKLTILPAGRPLPNSAELLGSHKMITLIEEMKKRYPSDRIILFDSPSLLCADPLVLSRYIDGVLLVVEQEKTTAQELYSTMELLKDCRIIGTVLNKSKQSKIAYL